MVREVYWECFLNQLVDLLVIIKHLGLWDIKARPPPKATATPPDFHIDYSNSQIPPFEDYLYYNPDYPAGGWIDAYAQA